MNKNQSNSNSQQAPEQLAKNLAEAFMRLGPKTRLVLVAVVAALLAVLYYWNSCSHGEGVIAFETDDKINVTPEKITSIEAIGQWEFLSIADEELVDTTRKRLLGSDHLVRIYYGTLRLGIDMRKAKPGWAKVNGDSIDATLPRVGLLDNRFIDEARTKSFYETGKWSGEDLETMYRRADRLMRQHALTPANLQSARQNAESQFRQMFQAMGFRHITIRFDD